MANYTAMFQRVEQKYLLPAEQYRAMLAQVEERLRHDRFPYSLVSSLYWDTPTNDIVRRLLGQPLFKEKLRLRMYDSISEEDALGNRDPLDDRDVPVNMDAHQNRTQEAFVELKTKYDGVTYKRRLRLSADAAKAFLSGMEFMQACSRFPLTGESGAATPSRSEQQVAREVCAFLERHPHAQPAMVVRCMRSAWKEKGTQLRITFDRYIQAGRPAGDPFALQIGQPLLEPLQPGQALMEVKQVGGIPLWLVDVLSEQRIYPCSFSKYSAAFLAEQAMLKETGARACQPLVT